MSSTDMNPLRVNSPDTEIPQTPEAFLGMDNSPVMAEDTLTVKALPHAPELLPVTEEVPMKITSPVSEACTVDDAPPAMEAVPVKETRADTLLFETASLAKEACTIDEASPVREALADDNMPAVTDILPAETTLPALESLPVTEPCPVEPTVSITEIATPECATTMETGSQDDTHIPAMDQVLSEAVSAVTDTPTIIEEPSIIHTLPIVAETAPRVTSNITHAASSMIMDQHLPVETGLPIIEPVMQSLSIDAVANGEQVAPVDERVAIVTDNTPENTDSTIMPDPPRKTTSTEEVFALIETTPNTDTFSTMYTVTVKKLPLVKRALSVKKGNTIKKAPPLKNALPLSKNALPFRKVTPIREAFSVTATKIPVKRPKVNMFPPPPSSLASPSTSSSRSTSTTTCPSPVFMPEPMPTDAELCSASTTLTTPEPSPLELPPPTTITTTQFSPEIPIRTSSIDTTTTTLQFSPEIPTRTSSINSTTTQFSPDTPATPSQFSPEIPIRTSSIVQSRPATPPNTQYIPKIYFFYRYLASPKQLKNILRSEEEPRLIPAVLPAYKIMKWGDRVTLMMSQEGMGKGVEGMAFAPETEEEENFLEVYMKKSFGRRRVELVVGESRVWADIFV